MKEIVFYAATSVDNRISDNLNSVAWLDSINEDLASKSDDDPIKMSYPHFYHDVDMVILGRKTYEEVAAMDFPYPYTDKPNYVVTQTPTNFNDANVTDFITYQQLLNILEKSTSKKIWICGGAELFNNLLTDKLITRIILTQMPVILGSGARLFNNLEQVNLNLVRVTESLPYIELEYVTKF